MGRSVKFDLVADPSRYGRGFREADRINDRFARGTKRHFQRGGDDAGQQFGLRFNKRLGHGFSASTRIAKLAVGGIAGAFAGLAVGGFLKDAIDAASDLNESISKSQVVFGKSSKAIAAFAKNSARDLGLSRQQAIEAAATFGNLFVAMKIGQKPAADMSTRIVKLAGDLASFNNVSPTEALDALRSGLVGETEPLRRFGINLNDATLRQEALRLGLTKTTKEVLPPAIKAQAAYSLILQQSKTAQGDFARTSKGAANQQRIFAASIEDLKAKIGSGLLPVFNSAIRLINDRFIPAASRMTNEFLANFRPELGRLKFAWEENKGAILGFVTSLDESQGSMVTSQDAARGLADALERLIEFSGDLANFGDRAAGHLNDMAESLQKTGHGLNTMLRAVPALGPVLEFLDQTKGETQALATATDLASTASERHARALTGQKQALEALKGALEGEKASELDLRQAKINVAVSQSRLNDLKRTGKTRSVDYKQAQIDLERAQLALKRQTDAYREAQRKANAATSGAMTASQRATTPVRTLGLAAETGGKRAGAARVPWRKLGEDAAGAMARIKSKRARIIANFGWQGLEVFRVGPKGQTRLAFAEGGEVNGPGTSTSDSIPARLSRGEHVWSAREVRGAGGHRAVEGLRREARGFAQGGTIPQFGMTGTGGFVKALNSWESRVTKILNVGAKAFGNTVKAIGGNPAIKRFILGTDPLPYRWGAAGPGAYDCSGLVGAVYGKLTGRGGGHGQRYFTTSSISTAVPGLKPGLGGVFQIGVTAGTGHMAGRYGGLGFEAESTRTGIKTGSAASRPESFARHFHMARGGPVDDKMLAVLSRLRGVDIGGDAGKLRINGKVFDHGGYLMPGATLAVNRTGRPEPVGAGRITREEARMIAQELAKVIPTRVAVDDIHTGLLSKKGRYGGMALGIG